AEGEEAEPEAPGEVALPLVVRYEWQERSGAVQWFGPASTRPAWVEAASLGAPLGRVPLGEGWSPLPDEVAARLATTLTTTSFLELTTPDGRRTRVLVQEEGMAHKPSLFEQLSVEEILRYWSLLSAEQRAAFLEEKGQALLAEAGGVAP